MTLPDQRFAYSAINRRPKWELPNGARIAVYTIVNVENGDNSKPVHGSMSRRQRVVTVPNIPNWSGTEYGMRSVSGD
jgi:hypothetical protein